MSIKQQQHIARYGKISPVIAARYNNYQFVAAGNKVFYAKEWKSFSDFLVGYVPAIFDKEWWAAEIAKPPAECNQVRSWWEAMRQYAKTQQKRPDRTYALTHNHRSGSEGSLPECDAIYVNAGATAPLDALRCSFLVLALVMMKPRRNYQRHSNAVTL